MKVCPNWRCGRLAAQLPGHVSRDFIGAEGNARKDSLASNGTKLSRQRHEIVGWAESAKPNIFAGLAVGLRGLSPTYGAHRLQTLNLVPFLISVSASATHPL